MDKLYSSNGFRKEIFLQLKNQGKAGQKKHREALSKSLRDKKRPNRLTGKTLICATCKKTFYKQKSHITSEKNYCSYVCLGVSKKVELKDKVCPWCDSSFERGNLSAANYRKKKYCSLRCANLANPPPRLSGEDHPFWKGPEARRRRRHGSNKKWRNAVLSRDKATCQSCGIKNVVLVAHHIKPWETHPALRFEVDNGLTLCQECHFKEHDWNLSEQGVKALVDERGVLLRRWTGFCLNCKSFIMKRASDMKRADGTIRTYGFCSDACKFELGGILKTGKSKGTKLVPLFEAHSAKKSNSK
ncbi:MAG: HNH endonuclease [Pseudohongiellaceae bacterium]